MGLGSWGVLVCWFDLISGKSCGFKTLVLAPPEDEVGLLLDLVEDFGLNPIHTKGCFPPPGQSVAQNFKTKQAITLKLSDFSQISISKI